MSRQSHSASQQIASGTMPVAVRRILLFILGTLLAGALYLIAVRGEALLLDLSALSARVFCF